MKGMKPISVCDQFIVERKKIIDSVPGFFWKSFGGAVKTLKEKIGREE